MTLDEIFENEEFDTEYDGEVQYAISKCYREGIGTEVDIDKADEWYEKAVNNGFTVEENVEVSISGDAIDYENLSMFDLAKLCKKNDAKAVFEYVKRNENSPKNVIRTLEELDDNYLIEEDYIVKKYDYLLEALNKLFENESSFVSEEEREYYYGKQQNYLANGIEINSLVAFYQYIKDYINHPVDKYELEKIQKIANRGDVVANYICGRAMITGEVVLNKDDEAYLNKMEYFNNDPDKIYEIYLIENNANMDVLGAFGCFDVVLEKVDKADSAIVWATKCFVKILDDKYTGIQESLDELMDQNKYPADDLSSKLGFVYKYLRYNWLHKRVKEKYEFNYEDMSQFDLKVLVKEGCLQASIFYNDARPWDLEKIVDETIVDEKLLKLKYFRLVQMYNELASESDEKNKLMIKRDEYIKKCLDLKVHMADKLFFEMICEQTLEVSNSQKELIASIQDYPFGVLLHGMCQIMDNQEMTIEEKNAFVSTCDLVVSKDVLEEKYYEWVISLFKEMANDSSDTLLVESLKNSIEEFSDSRWSGAYIFRYIINATLGETVIDDVNEKLSEIATVLSSGEEYDETNIPAELDNFENGKEIRQTIKTINVANRFKKKRMTSRNLDDDDKRVLETINDEQLKAYMVETKPQMGKLDYVVSVLKEPLMLLIMILGFILLKEICSFISYVWAFFLTAPIIGLVIAEIIIVVLNFDKWKTKINSFSDRKILEVTTVDNGKIINDLEYKVK